MSKENLEIEVSAEVPSDSVEETRAVPAEEVKENVDSEEAEKAKPEEEMVTMTKKELDDKFARVRQISERKASARKEREIREKLQAEMSNQHEKQNQSSSDKTFWDESLKRNIPSSMTIEEYTRLISNPNAQQNVGYDQQTTVNNQQNVENVKSHQANNASAPKNFSMDADMQAIECDVDYPDFQQVLRESAPSVEMINAVAQDPDGIRNLYHKLKDDPAFAYKISRLSPQEQQHRMWQLNNDMKTKKVKNIVSKATPQPAPIRAGTKITVKEDEMSITELRRLRRKQEEERRKY